MSDYEMRHRPYIVTLVKRVQPNFVLYILCIWPKDEKRNK